MRFPFGLRGLAAAGAICLLATTPAQAGSLQALVQDKNGKPLPDAIVFLESTEAKAAAKPLKGIEIAQVARQFTPAVTVVTPGTSVLFPNQDTVRHHVYSFSPACLLYTSPSPRD